MKKVFIFMLLTVTAFAGRSQSTLFVERSTAGTISVIPQEYSYNGLPKIVASDYDEDSRTCEYKVFDSWLEPELSSTFSPHTVTAGTHREYGEEILLHCYGGETYYTLSDTVMSRVTIDIQQPSGETEKKSSGITAAEVEKYFIPTAPEVLYETTYWEWENSMYSPGYTIVKKEKSVCEYERKTMYGYPGIVFSNFIGTYHGRFTYNEWSNLSTYKNPYQSYRYDYESGGETKPFVFYLDEKGEFYKITFRKVVSKRISGFDMGTIYGADFSIVDDSPTYYVSSPLKVHVLNKGLSGGECVVTFSQTLFNDDADLEYVGYKYGNPQASSVEKDRDDDGYIDYRETTTVYSMVGILVMNTSNEILYSIDFPSGYKLATGDDIQILDMHENRYLIVPVNNINSHSNSGSHILIYRIDPEQSGIEQIGAPMRARVFPTIVSRGTDVVVELPSDQGDTDIMVTSMSGQTEMTGRVQRGTGHTSIPTNNLGNGVHVVSVTDREQNRRESTRIVVK